MTRPRDAVLLALPVFLAVLLAAAIGALAYFTARGQAPQRPASRP